jgi:hypothetical protein
MHFNVISSLSLFLLPLTHSVFAFSWSMGGTEKVKSSSSPPAKTAKSTVTSTATSTATATAARKTADKGTANGTVTSPDNADNNTATLTDDNPKSWVQQYFLNKLMLYGVLQGILTGLVVGGVLSAVMLQSAASEIEAMKLATQSHSTAASDGMN